jgi:hypothetical protein
VRVPIIYKLRHIYIYMVMARNLTEIEEVCEAAIARAKQEGWAGAWRRGDESRGEACG